VTDIWQNWFQNRRAKRKQEKKQEAYEAGQAQDALGYSEPSSPDYYNNSSAFFNDTHVLPMQQSSAPFPVMSGPPPAIAPYNPQYSDPSTASMESLHRTMAAAQAASFQQDFHSSFSEQNDTMSTFGGPLTNNASNGDRAQFPPNDGSLTHFDGSQDYSYGSNAPNSLYSTSHASMPELHASPTAITPTPYRSYSSHSISETNAPQVMTAFPSQLLPSQPQDGLPSLKQDNMVSQSPEEISPSTLAIGFKYDIPESDESSDSPPAPSIPFKSPPPMDIVSRRKKVHSKPAALTADTLKSRPQVGPRTVSHAEGFRRQSDSPISSPMRRIVSAGGNRNIISGRIGKAGIESAQRSPINLGGFADAGAFMEHNYHSIRQPPSLTAGSSLNSSLAPPTPMSPRGGEMTLVKRETARSTASPAEGGMNFVFNTNVPGCFTSMEGDQNLASPPETPQAHMGIHPLNNGWPTGIEFQDKQWHYEVPDEPLYTPAQDSFQLELQMPQPSYLSTLSQPVTPAFGQQFNPNFMFGGEGSPQYKHDSPQYTLSSHAEYSFPETHPQYTGGMSSTSPMTKQKTFQFSNTTAADFSEK